MIFCEKRTPRRLCEAVEEYASAAAGKMARRPFNRFEPDYTAWWLVPSAELPFYRHGKIYFNWHDDSRAAVSCGLFLEKGLAPEVAAVYNSRKGRSLIQDGRWIWNDFIRDCGDGTLTALFEDLRAASGLEPELHISGGYVDDPELFDPYNDRVRKDHYIFTAGAGGALNFLSARRDAMLLKSLNKVKSFDQLASAATVFGEDHFLWLNIFIGAGFGVCREEMPEEAECWNASRIWNEFLRFFLPWLK